MEVKQLIILRSKTFELNLLHSSFCPDGIKLTRKIRKVKTLREVRIPKRLSDFSLSFEFKLENFLFQKFRQF